jgi:chitin-binding protein
MPDAAGAADISPPTEPGAITVTGATASTVALRWIASTDNVGIEGYRVYRGSAAAADAALNLIATTDAVASYTATTLYSGVGYKFGVVAIDGANNKSAMRTVLVSTLHSTDTAKPAPPSSTSISGRAFSRHVSTWCGRRQPPATWPVTWCSETAF